MEFLLIIGLFILGAALFFGMWVLFEWLNFSRKYGFKTGKVYANKMPVYKHMSVSQEDVDIFCYSHPDFDKYLIKMEENFDVGMFIRTMDKCRIVCLSDLKSDAGQDISGKALRFSKVLWRQETYLILINISRLKRMGVNPKAVGHLVAHELAHHFVFNTTGAGDAEHTHPIFKLLNS